MTDRPAAIGLEQALVSLESDPGLDGNVVAVLQKALGQAPSAPEQKWPAGLTRREVDVLRLAAQGLTRAQIGTRLKITENTVRHHLEHIYDKIGASSRVTATLFAIESGLLS
jgi:DNA-binding NarL/FixJ family response regulator